MMEKRPARLLAAAALASLALIVAGCGSSASPGPSGGSAPSTPTGLAVSGSPTADSVSLTWDAASGASGYRVYRSTDQSVYAQAGADVASGAAFSDSGLAPSTTYYYEVSAFNASGESPRSSQVSAATAASGGGSGAAAIWYGRTFNNATVTGMELYEAVAGGPDVHKFSYTDFDHNCGTGILVGSAFYYTSGGNIYQLVAGSGNDVLIMSAADFDHTAVDVFWLGTSFGYTSYDSGTAKYYAYRLVAGASNDVQLFAPSDFDLAPATYGGGRVAGGGNLYYKAGTTVGDLGWYRLSSGTDAKVVGYGDYDVAGNFSTENYTGAGNIYARDDYTHGGLVKIVAGTGNDAAAMAAAELDGDLPNSVDGTGVHYAKPDVVNGGYGFYVDQN
jgi:hypothetical protein